MPLVIWTRITMSRGMSHAFRLAGSAKARGETASAPVKREMGDGGVPLAPVSEG
jgi:hypothetical protein